jgi:hypothetical protein
MGEYFTDQFSLLHFSVGVVAYFFGIPLILFIILHTIFEIVENTKTGMYIINKYFTFWPGGKPSPDTLLNSFGDTVYSIIGFIIANQLDKYYKK